MRLVRFVHEGRRSFGVATSDGVIDLGRRLPSTADLDDVVTTGRLGDALALAAGASPDLPAGAVELLKPLARPGKILCVGVNYPDRNAEYRDGSVAPRYPSLFVRFPESLVAPEAPIVRPRESIEFDYEGELVVMVGRAGRRIPPAAAWDHLAGVTIGNDGSVRDWVRHGKFNVTPGKNFDQSGAMGPWITTLDEFPRREWQVTTTVNGERRQHDSTDRMLFLIPDLVAYISTFTTLEPGDLIFTGTPSGAGARLTPPRYLEPGDVVSVTVSGVGTLTNTVVQG